MSRRLTQVRQFLHSHELFIEFCFEKILSQIRSDPDLFVGSGNFDRIPDPDLTLLKVLIINQKRCFFHNIISTVQY
jgi:hypothetical protein